MAILSDPFFLIISFRRLSTKVLLNFASEKAEKVIAAVYKIRKQQKI
jgi:hypothetical protein